MQTSMKRKEKKDSNLLRKIYFINYQEGAQLLSASCLRVETRAQVSHWCSGIKLREREKKKEKEKWRREKESEEREK